MRVKWFLLACLLVMIGGGVQAQSDDLTVYVYEPILGELMRVDSTGNMEAYSLGFENTRFIQIGNMEINEAGTQIVFCYIDHDQSRTGPRQATFVVRDILAETNMLTVNLGDAASCEVGAYNPDETQITVAHVVYETFFPEQELDPNRASWRLLVVDTATGEIVQSLDGNQPDAPTIAFGDMTVEQILARTVAFEEGRVLFQAFPYIPTEVFVDTAYAWDLSSGELQPFPNLNVSTFAYLPGAGELVFGAQSENVAMPPAMGMGPSYNAIGYQQGIDGAPQTLFESSEETVGRLLWVYDGERILAQLNDTSDMMTPQTRWVLMDRTGAITDEFTAPEIVRGVMDTGDGLVVLNDEPVPQSFPTTVLSFYDGETLNEFWRYPFPEEQESFSGFNLIWVSN